MTDAWSAPAGAGTDAAVRVPDPLVAELARLWPDGGRAAPARVAVLALLAGAVAAALVVDSAPASACCSPASPSEPRRCRRCGTGWVRTSWPSAPSACCCSPSSWCATHPGWSR